MENTNKDYIVDVLDNANTAAEQIHTKHTSKYIEKAWDDEELFVLMERDATTPKIILEWIKENLNVRPKQQLREAFETALRMIDNRNKPAVKTVPSKLNRDEDRPKYNITN